MQCHRASKRLFPFHLFFLNFSFFLWVPLYPYVCVSISTTCCLTSKDTVAVALVHIFPGRNPKTHTHRDTMLCHSGSLFLSPSHSQTHAHRQCTSNTLPSLSLSHSHMYKEPLRKCWVFGCSVIAGAEKAMCLQWQVHSGVSSVPTTRLQNNIALSSSAYADTHTHQNIQN